MEPLSQGYLLAGQEAAKAAEGKCGEGKCGMAKADTDKDGKVSQAEFNAAHPDKAAKFAEIDTNKDGFIDAAEHKAHAGKLDGKIDTSRSDEVGQLLSAMQRMQTQVQSVIAAQSEMAARHDEGQISYRMDDSAFPAGRSPCKP